MSIRNKTILVLPGDGIGPEIITEALKVLDLVNERLSLQLSICYGALGGDAIDRFGVPFPEETKQSALNADAILFGSVGGPKWDALPRDIRPEKGLLAIRSALGLFANLRPAILYPQLADASSLKPEVVSGLNLLIVRELTGGIYFGQPRGIRVKENQVREGFNTEVYDENEIRRIGKVAFEAAMLRGKKVCSVDKCNVLESSELWREVMDELSASYPEVSLSHMYIDNAAMQLVKAPKQFDVIVTGNLFGDILSDEAAMLTGSIGMLPSASLNEKGQGLYEPCHGSAPDIAGLGVANPLATILSLAMLFQYSLQRKDIALKIEQAVERVLASGARTRDLYTQNQGFTLVSTKEMGDWVVDHLGQLL